ncbi:MAG: hypothetical protein R2697_22135 [Ilumatobacteraceae bacterium]
MLPVSGAEQFKHSDAHRALTQLDRDITRSRGSTNLTGLGIGQEEVPQPLLFRLRLDRLQQLELALAITLVLGPTSPSLKYFGLRLTSSAMNFFTASYNGLALSDIRRSNMSTVDGNAVMRAPRGTGG